MSQDALRLGRSYLAGLAARLSLAALLAAAPLACVLFCAAVSEASARGAPVGHIAHHAPEEDGRRAPLTDLQQLVRAVTDSLLVAAAWAAAWHVVAAPIALRPAALRVDLPPPTPPPRPIFPA